MKPLRGIASDGLYWFCHYWCHTAYEVLFHGSYEGIEFIPREGPFLIAANHASHLDPPMIGSVLPRKLVFFARKTLWKKGLASWWLDSVGAIPVDRDGESDVTALKRTLSALRSGQGLILFPEGTRTENGELQTAKPGIGLIACKTGVPVIPARIFGSYEIMGRHRQWPDFTRSLSVRFGPLLSPGEYDPGPGAGKGRYALAASRIMSAIARLEEVPGAKL